MLVPLDQDAHLHSVLERSQPQGSLRLAWACLPETDVAQQTPAKRRSSGSQGRSSRGSEASTDTMFSEEERDLSGTSGPLTIIVHLGTAGKSKGTGVGMPNQRCIRIRKNSSGDDLYCSTLDVDELNGAINSSLFGVDFQRGSHMIWLVDYNAQKNIAVNMTIVRGPDDFIFKTVEGCVTLRVAIEMREVPPAANLLPAGRKQWHPNGAASAPHEGDGRIQRPQIVPMVKTCWLTKGFFFDENNPLHMAAINYHANGIYNSSAARTEAEDQNRVTWIPSSWPSYNPTRAPPPAMGLLLPSQDRTPAPAAAPAQLPAEDAFITLLKKIKLVHHAEALSKAGIVEAADLQHAVASDLEALGLNKFEAARLLRHVE